MKGLIQRVTRAEVCVADESVGEIAKGLLLFLGVEKGDTQADADRLLERILGYRVFADEQDRMNVCLNTNQCGLLIVPQFTLAADTRKGLRPSFSTAAPPGDGLALYEYFVEQAKQQHSDVATGRFGADMAVHLVNDGPVTFLL